MKTLFRMKHRINMMGMVVASILILLVGIPDLADAGKPSDTQQKRLNLALGKPVEVSSTKVDAKHQLKEHVSAFAEESLAESLARPMDSWSFENIAPPETLDAPDVFMYLTLHQLKPASVWRSWENGRNLSKPKWELMTAKTGGNWDVEVDHENLSAVPEPSTIILVGVGMAGIWWLRKRIRR